MRDSKRTFMRIIGTQWAATCYGTAMMFFLMVFLARMLGPASLAIFLYVQAVASLFAIIQDGGFQTLLFREKVSSSQEIGLSPDALVSGYFSYLILVTLLGSAAALVSPVAFKPTLILAFLYFALRCVTNMVSSLLKGQGSFTQEALWRFQINTFLVIPVVLILWQTSPSPEKVFLGFLVGQLILLTISPTRKFLLPPTWTWPPWRIWKTCLSFVVISGATMVYFKSGIVLLKHLQPDLALVGYYGAAFQFLEGVILLATPVVHLLFRHMRLSWLDRDIFCKRFGKSLSGVIAVALLITFVGICGGPEIVILFFGKTYYPAADILPLLLLSLIFILPNFILTQGLIALNGERYYAVAAFSCAVFNVGLNLYLIPRYSANGAAISTLATEIFLSIFLIGWFIRWWRTGRNTP